MRRILTLGALLALTLLSLPAMAADEDEGAFNAGTFSGLELRSLGPALTSGRIADFAVDPANHARYFVAVCSGGVWRTENAGTTWTPVFDDEGSYSIGCVTLDPNDPQVVWVGTGENNSQRSVAFGDGLYKSIDGGDSWTKVGLEDSEHIAKIVVDPRDSDIVYVAAQGPLWNAGGDRGLYKTVNGGQSWELVLDIDEHTGVTDLVMDPRDPDVLYAATYQRRRHVWTLINGGPGSGIHKSIDGGVTWNETSKGLPSVDMGRIGLAMAPSDPDHVYAIIEAAEDEGGFFRTTDGGASWDKRSDHVSGSPQYYQEIQVDPHNAQRVFSLSTFTNVSDDGGESWRRLSNESRHVDDHALWIDPEGTDHLLIGGDGGIYESWDLGEHWDFKENLPVTQFYRICVDNDLPFYNIYGGTQDNNTQGGPCRTINNLGIINSDWYITCGGDGFEPQVDPDNPDIVYSQSQYGGLVRYDRQSGQEADIRPAAAPGAEPDKFNWNAPLLISPHQGQRLYYASQRIYRSDDRGDSWSVISGDLTRRLDRNELEIMDRVWSIDAVAKNRSTSIYGSIVFLAESPVREGLLYAGTDDGLIQVSDDGGATWRSEDSFKDTPDMCLVSCVTPSFHDEDTVYASFDNHKKGDYLPYLLKSTDRGKKWKSISGDLPERGTVYSVVEDHVRPGLLFAGTEFGVFFTIDDGEHWVQLSSGIPTICARDLDIQRRENDLVVGTFGRGFYVLDDYTPLRHVTPDALEADAMLFPIRKSLVFLERTPMGWGARGDQGANLFRADNPPLGAVFTWYLKDSPTTLRDERREEEKEIAGEGGDVAYPSWDELRAEDREPDSELVMTIRDADGNVVRRLDLPTGSGIHRASWDFRYPTVTPVDLDNRGPRSPWDWRPTGHLAAPGTYTADLTMVKGETSTVVAPTRTFEIEPLQNVTLPGDARELLAFQKEAAKLHRALLGGRRAAGEVQSRIDHLLAAVFDTPGADPVLRDRLLALDDRMHALRVEMNGDRILSRASEPTPMTMRTRINRAIYGTWSCTSAPTQTQRDCYDICADQFGPWLDTLREIAEIELVDIEEKLEDAGAPWTPGRLPEWPVR